MDEKKDIESFYPLSPMQQGMLFHTLLEPNSGAYFEQMACGLRGRLDVPSFEKAWQQVVDRNGALRTSFLHEGLKEPVQVVRRNLTIPLCIHNWRDVDPARHESALEEFLRHDRESGFRVSDPPLMRLNLIRTAETAYHFIWSYHHLLLDGWSVPLVLKEVMALYESFSRGRRVRLPPTRPYRDYLVWIRKQDPSKAEAFWRPYLKGLSGPTQIRPSSRSDGAGNGPFLEEEIWLDSSTSAALETFCKRSGLTPNTLIQAAWALLLGRYSGEEDVVFGVTVSGRPPYLEGVETMVGLFINTIPMRLHIPPEATLLPWLRQIQSQSAAMREFEHCSLVQIHGLSEVPRGTPLFESILVYENYPEPDSMGSENGAVEIIGSRSVEQTNYPLALIAGFSDRFLLKINYDRSILDTATIRRMLVHLETLLRSMSADPGQTLEKLVLLTPAERNQLMVEWNATRIAYPQRDRCVHQLLETRVAESPDSTAVIGGNQALSYAELNRRANRIARCLQRRGVGPESVVAICMERSLEMAAGILGILKAGAAYLPLDPAYPEDRVAFMVEDSGAQVILTQEKLKSSVFSVQGSGVEKNEGRGTRGEGRERRTEVGDRQLPPTSNLQPPTIHLPPTSDLQSPTVLCLDSDWPEIARESDKNPVVAVDPATLAYVIYTSGSMGRPKGTMVQHRGVTNLTLALIDLFGIGPESRVLQFASFGFDASVTEFFPTFAVGGTLCSAPQEVLSSGPDLVQLIRDEAIDIVTLPPSLLSVIQAEDLPGLRTLVSAGEPCSWEIVSRWAPGRRFLNGYGPTETTVAASYYRAEEGRAGEIGGVPVGRPNPNTQIHVLGGDLQPAPVGAAGEIHVGGVCLARGYLGRADLTAEKFIPHPFSAEPGARLYKTGDLARYLPDGNVEFAGRVDHQVKIRGFRIELGEIEAALKEHPAVEQAAVTVWETASSEKRIAAYVVLGPSAVEPPAGEWRRFLMKKLPGYMIPFAFVTMDNLPCSPSGKLDRKALPLPPERLPHHARAPARPRDSVEAQLVALWEEVFDLRPIGLRDDFFELGGHSLLAVRLISQVKARFQRELPLLSLYQNPTVEWFARLLREDRTTAPFSSLVALQPKGSARPLFFSHPSGGSVHWYADLARLMAAEAGSEQPLYGLQAIGLDDERNVQTRIEDMAATYVKAIRTLQSKGPYRIGGWSLGVVIAFEMAQQIREQGETVEFLLMLDQGPALPAREPSDQAEYLVDVFGKHLPLSLEDLRRLEEDQQVAHVWKEALRAEWLYPDVDLDQFRRYVHVLKTHAEAWRRYVSKSYPGRITVFRAETQTDVASQAADLGWGGLAAGGTEVHEVPGDHITMLEEPHVRIVAEKMRACLGRCPAPGARALR